jgi:hypothetical protein
MTLSMGRSLNLISAVCGCLGTASLYKGSFAYEAPAVWANEQFLKDMAARNLKRRSFQQAGLALISPSFILQGVAQFFE